MKIAQILGRGIEGAGVSRYAYEMNQWLLKNGFEATIYVSNDKIWPRSKKAPIKDYIVYDKIEQTKLIDLMNSYDYVFIHSVPSVKHSQECQDKFKDLVQNITKTKVIFQNDHKPQSLARNANFLDICEMCDRIASFGLETPFYKKVKERLGNEEAIKRYVHLHNSFDMSRLLPFQKKEHIDRITYLGRFATFKDPKRMLSLLETRNIHHCQTECIGIERSIGAVCSFFRKEPDKPEENPDILFFNQLEQIDNRDDSKLYTFGPYDWEDGVKALSNSLFGASFYHLPPATYGDNIEYAQVEMVGVGCIPIFDYGFGESVCAYKNGKSTGIRLIDIPNFALFLKKDLSNLQEVAQQIEEIRKSPELQEKYRKTSFDVIANHVDINAVNQQLLKDLGAY